MVVESEIIVVALGILFGYIISTEKSKGAKVLSDIIYLASGITLMAYNTANTYAAIGLIIALSGLIKAIIDLMGKSEGIRLNPDE